MVLQFKKKENNYKVLPTFYNKCNFLICKSKHMIVIFSQKEIY